MQNIAECKQGKVTIGSICTGMATAEIVLAQLQECFPGVEALAQKQFCWKIFVPWVLHFGPWICVPILPQDMPPEFELRFMVEKDKKKRAWLRERFPKVTIFKDMVDLAKKKAETDDDSYEVVPKVGGGKNACL